MKKEITKQERENAIALVENIKFEAGKCYIYRDRYVFIEEAEKGRYTFIDENGHPYKRRGRRRILKVLEASEFIPLNSVDKIGTQKVGKLSKVLSDDEINTLSLKNTELLRLKVSSLVGFINNELGKDYTSEAERVCVLFAYKYNKMLQQKRDELAQKAAQRINEKSAKVASEVKNNIVNEALKNAIENLISKGLAQNEDEAKLILGI